ESGDGEIETTPEEVHRARLAEERGTETLHHDADAYERLKEAADGLGIIGARCAVLREGDPVRNFARAAVESRRCAERAQQIEKARVKLGDGHRRELDVCDSAARRAADD